MGLFDAVKNLFTEEIEVEETPIKKEVMKVEIPAPVREPVKETPKPKEVEPVQTRMERLEPKIEEKQRTPVFFDDKDFINLEQPRVVKKPEVKVEPKKQEVYGAKKEPYGVKKEEVKKKFSPSPIISPVYGVLDKNYHKEDISSRTEKTRKHHSSYGSKNLSLDDVMKKAYGTLEDDLETTMTQMQPVKENASAMFDDFDFMPESTPTRSDKKSKIDPISGLELDVNENDDLLNEDFDKPKKAKRKVKEENLIAEEMDKAKSKEELNMKESELFNLIDSMYEKRDDE